MARTTEVSLGRVKWNLTDKDGQLNLAQFEMKDFLYEKVTFEASKNTWQYCVGFLTFLKLFDQFLLVGWHIKLIMLAKIKN